MTGMLPVVLMWGALGGTAPAPEGPPSASLEIDVSALPSGRATRSLETHLREHQTRTIEDGGVKVTDDAELTIRVIVNRYGEGNVNYRATVVLLERGLDQPRMQRTVSCDLCRDGDLVIRVGEEVAHLASLVLYAPEEEGEPEAEPQEKAEPQEEAEPTFPAEDDEPSPPPPGRIGLLGFSGIGSMVIGTGALVGGIPLALRPDRARPVESGVERQSTRPTGFTLIGVGSALLVTGTALLVVDVVRRRKQRKISMMPFVSPSAVTVSMGVRF